LEGEEQAPIQSVFTWKVVYKLPFPVHSEQNTSSKFLGTKKPGTTVRGIQDGEWVTLHGEPGFMRLEAKGSGAKVLEKIEDASEQVVEAKVSTWCVAFVPSLPVYKEPDVRSSYYYPKVPGSVFRGTLDGDWLTLIDEYGFMKVTAEDTKQDVLQRMVSNEINGDCFNIVIDKDKAAAEGINNLGIDVDLSDRKTLLIERVKPGFVQHWNTNNPDKAVLVGDHIMEINGARNNCQALVERCKLDRVLKIEICRSNEVPFWMITTTSRTYAVLSEKDIGSQLLTVKRLGDRIRGSPDGEWLALADEPGFMRIFNTATGERILQIADDLIEPNEMEAATAPKQNSAAPLVHQPGTLSITLVKETMGNRKLGVDVSVVGEGRHLKIKKIREGLLHAWNQQNPTEALREGDVIMDVNGVHGGSEELYGTIANDNVLKLTIMRREFL